MKKRQKKFKKGATSFYIVAFSTLILVIIAVSFASVIISAISRTSDDELAQSAYDSALAGVEDAKLAYTNYIKCREAGNKAAASEPAAGAEVTCENIMYWMEHPNCDMVGNILGRPVDGGVMIRETVDNDNKMEQAYTCAKIDVTIDDYRATLTSSNQAKVVRVNFSENDAISSLNKVRVSWYINKNTSDKIKNYSNFSAELSRVAFFPIGDEAVADSIPPTLMVGLIQTSKDFSLDEFKQSFDTQTNRATVYLVPTSPDVPKNVVENGNAFYTGAYRSSTNSNFISASSVAKTNSHETTNKPFAVLCSDANTDEFACSVDIEIPDPIGNDRNNETFAITVSTPYPYGQVSTDFSLKFFCREGILCNESSSSVDDGNVATMSNTQVAVDSTGRANNLYRRVLTRLESPSNKSVMPFYAVQLTGQDANGYSIYKNLEGITTN